MPRADARSLLELATLADRVERPDDYLYELKYDGYRIAATRSGRTVRLASRRGQDWTAEFATVAKAVATLSARRFTLDGEVCAPDERGVPSFQRLQRRRSADVRLVYLPHLKTQRAVGSLVLALDQGGRLTYAGKVGTGFDEKTRVALAKRLDAHPAKEPAAEGVPRFGGIGRWSQPRLVAEVAFTEWTQGGHVRHPSFQGLRPDKTPMECVRERPLAAADGAMDGAAAATPGDLVAGIRITHPTRVLRPPGVTKIELARYYDAVADCMLPHVRGRPLSLLRWAGADPGEKGGIYRRHGREWGPKELRRLRIQEKTKVGEYLVADTREALVALAQMDILEIHTWNSTADHLEQPDRVVLDVDPGPSVGWDRTVRAARTIREVLDSVGLRSFVKTTGGKGLHVVVPLVPAAGWGECLAFTRALAVRLHRDHPREYVATMSKAQRRGRIFVDYLRNNRGSTSVAAFSTRARAGTPVSMPVAWEDLDDLDPAAFTLRSVSHLLANGWVDPWKGYARVRQRLTPATTRALDRA